MLKYSQKQDRESYNGLLKAAGGLGSTLPPLLVSFAVAFLDYWFVYVFVLAIIGILTPFIHFTLKRAQAVFEEEKAR